MLRPQRRGLDRVAPSNGALWGDRRRPQAHASQLYVPPTAEDDEEPEQLSMYFGGTVGFPERAGGQSGCSTGVLQSDDHRFARRDDILPLFG